MGNMDLEVDDLDYKQNADCDLTYYVVVVD